MISISGALSLLAVIAGFFIVKIAEYRVHETNYSFLVENGAEELIPDLMRSYYRFNLIMIFIIAIEGVVRGEEVEIYVKLAGLLIIGSSLLLRIWTINSLGRYWSMRCLFLPGYPRIEIGPYRYLSCPEYFSRGLDIIGFSIFLQARWSLLIGLVLSMWHVVRILRVEKRQLFELSFTPRQAVRQHLSHLDLDRSVE